MADTVRVSVTPQIRAALQRAVTCEGSDEQLSNLETDCSTVTYGDLKNALTLLRGDPVNGKEKWHVCDILRGSEIIEEPLPPVEYTEEEKRYYDRLRAKVEWRNYECMVEDITAKNKQTTPMDLQDGRRVFSFFLNFLVTIVGVGVAVFYAAGDLPLTQKVLTALAASLIIAAVEVYFIIVRS
eukprot:Clim_evm6s235 gene=Clim_evmTU6s235